MNTKSKLFLSAALIQMSFLIKSLVIAKSHKGGASVFCQGWQSAAICRASLEKKNHSAGGGGGGGLLNTLFPSLSKLAMQNYHMGYGHFLPIHARPLNWQATEKSWGQPPPQRRRPWSLHNLIYTLIQIFYWLKQNLLFENTCMLKVFAKCRPIKSQRCSSLAILLLFFLLARRVYIQGREKPWSKGQRHIILLSKQSSIRITLLSFYFQLYLVTVFSFIFSQIFIPSCSVWSDSVAPKLEI